VKYARAQIEALKGAGGGAHSEPKDNKPITDDGYMPAGELNAPPPAPREEAPSAPAEPSGETAP
jgi:hypothetical protein